MATAEPASDVRPVFLFGMERSGTTLLSMMVGAHSEIAVPLATTGMWIDFGQRLAAYGDLKQQDGLVRLVDDILGHERIKLWDAALDRERILDGLPLGDYGALLSRVHSEYARAKGKPHWANIDIATLDHMELVNEWLPTARFVQIVRDGRDVALSHQTMPYGSGNIADCAHAWAARVSVNAKMGRILGPERYCALRFEDLVGDSETTLRRLCQFLAVPFDPAMLHYAAMVEEKIPVDRRWLWPALDQPPQSSKVGLWHQAMTQSQRIVFEDIAAATLRQWGYETFQRRPKSVRAYLLALWYFVTQGGRLRRLGRRLGLARRSLLERRADQSRVRS
ncbi:MAG: sulfotransferase [Kiloniellaceae bacterium]